MVKPTIVCLCGSTKFKDAFVKAQFEETIAGNIVLTIGCAAHSDPELYSHLSFKEWLDTKRRLDWLHFEKIRLADEVLVLNVNGYIGLSTCDEIGLAVALGKPVRWLEGAPGGMDTDLHGLERGIEDG